MSQKRIIELAAQFGVKVTFTNEPSGKSLCPEKMAIANEIISKLQWPIPYESPSTAA